MKSFPNTKVVANIPCEATTQATCTTAESAEECMKRCIEPQCYWGTYSEETKICKPVSYYTHKDLNPSFLFRPEPRTTTFVNTNFFTVPAQRNNQFFFYDKIRLQNVETEYIIKPDVVLRPVNPYLPHPAMDFIPITNQTPVLFYDRQLDSVLRAEGENINWYKAIENLNTTFEAFYLIPEPNIEQPRRNISYSEVFTIRTSLKQIISLPPMYNIAIPRINDLVVRDNITSHQNLPHLFRFIYLPTPAIGL
jgi:hypothetical protein